MECSKWDSPYGLLFIARYVPEKVLVNFFNNNGSVRGFRSEEVEVYLVEITVMKMWICSFCLIFLTYELGTCEVSF